MPKISRSLLPLLAGLALVPAADAHAGAKLNAPIKHTFTGTFEAQRIATWDRPRAEGGGDCNGKHWAQSDGSENQVVKTRKPFKLVVAGSRRFPTWTFGNGPAVRDPRDYGIDAAGPHTRTWNVRGGWTGGWCGGPKSDPPLKNDCGTQLSEYKLTLYGRTGGIIDWGLSYKTLPRERQGFTDCRLLTPAGFPVGSFPRMEGTLKMSDVLNTRKRTIVVKQSKTFGPESSPIAPGVNETRSAEASWKLTLTRSR
jgi:hypothetical protein